LSVRTRKFVLEFEGDVKPELVATLYFCPITGRELRSIRGRVSPSRSGLGTFQWTSAVIALSIAFLRARIVHEAGSADKDWTEQASLQGRSGSFAASLDFALSKEPLWLQEMFGVDSSGNAIGRRIFTRVNSEGKRVGPTSVILNRSFIAPSDIMILLNGKSVVEIHELRDVLTQLLSTEIVSLDKNETKKTNFSLSASESHPFDFFSLPYGKTREGISRSLVMFEDAVIEVLGIRKALSAPTIAELLADSLSLSINNNVIDASIERLMRRGILRKKDTEFILNAHWYETRSRLIESVADIGREFRLATEGKSNSISKLSVRLRLNSLIDYDKFVPILFREVIRDFTQGNSSGDELFHPWWEKTEMSSFNNSEKRLRANKITYVSGTNQSTDAWTHDLYKGFFSEEQNLSSKDFLDELWIYDDILIRQYLAPTLQLEVEQMKEARSVNLRALRSKSKKGIFTSPCPVNIHIVVVPGLSALLGSLVSSEKT